MRIRACYSFGQVAQQITSFTLNARVLALRNNRVLIGELRYTHKTEEATTKVHKRHKRTKGTNSEKLLMCLLFFLCLLCTSIYYLSLPRLHLREALLEVRGISLVCLAFLHGLFAQRYGLFLLPGLVQRIRLRREVLERLLHFDRLVQPRHALLIVRRILVVDEIVSGLHRRTPVVRLRIANGRLQVRQRCGRDVRNLNRERHVDLLPANVYLRRVFGHRIERVFEPLLIVVQPLRFHFYTQRVFRCTVVEAAPLVRSAGEYDAPLVFSWNRVQAVTSGRELLPVDQNVVSHDELRRFIRARAPYVTIWHDRSAGRTLVLIVECRFASGGLSGQWVTPDLSTFHGRTAVSDRDVGDTDS